MSQENIELVRRAYDLWNQSGPAAVAERCWAEDAIYREWTGATEPRVYKSRGAALARMRSLVELVGALEVSLDEILETEDGRVVAFVQIAGETTRESPYTQSFAVVHRLRDGLIVEADYYLERADALNAAGLRE
jgi:ketosteroid isomerase-like protein